MSEFDPVAAAEEILSVEGVEVKFPMDENTTAKFDHQFSIGNGDVSIDGWKVNSDGDETRMSVYKSQYDWLRELDKFNDESEQHTEEELISLGRELRKLVNAPRRDVEVRS